MLAVFTGWQRRATRVRITSGHGELGCVLVICIRGAFRKQPNFKGGTDSGWVTAVYTFLLGRAPDQSGLAYWANQLATLESQGETSVQARSQVALLIANGHEHDTKLINDDYFHYLGRAADSSGLHYWLSQFANDATNEDAIAGFTGSAEYYQEKTGVSR